MNLLGKRGYWDFQKQVLNTYQIAKSGFPWDGPTRGMCARTFELVKIATFLQQLWYKNL